MIGLWTPLLLLSAPAEATTGVARIYYNSAYVSSASLAKLSQALVSGGATSVSTSTSSSWPSSSSTYAAWDVVIIILPGASFSVTQANALESYVAAGGRVVLVGEYELTAYGVCLAGYCTENDRINTLLSNMGSDMALGESPVAYTGCATATDFGGDQLDDGLSNFVFTTSNTISNGIDVVQYSGSTIVAVDQSSSTSHARTPYDIVVVGDWQAMTTTSYGGCTNAANTGYNYTFWENLYSGVLCPDSDSDGYTDAECGGEDCDDSDTSVSPSSYERCDGLDNDCNGTVDDDPLFGGTTYYRDSDSDGYGLSSSTTDACSLPSGYSATSGDCDDSVASINPGAAEYCDDVDNDCDGSTDETSSVDAPTWYRDADGDSYGRSTVTTRACDVPSGYSGNNTDCDDTRSSVYPGAPETCNSRDDDCDGTVDDSPTDATTYYRDADSDGYGTTSTTTSSCSAVSGYVTNSTDCDDGLATVNPAATEYCNSRDDDCDGSTDESSAADALTWYRDADGDTYGWAATSTLGCTTPSGYVANDDDCDDTRGLSNPAATEYCNSADDDCDGTVDEGDAADARTWYDDDDADTYGDPADLTQACSAPSGSVSTGTDCDDTRATVHPGATESCNTLDDDCDGSVDEAGALGESTWYVDSDHDTYGNSTLVSVACDAPTDGVSVGGDCDDGDATAYPGAAELCDGKDDDCDSLIDEGATDSAAWYADDDGDGYGDALRSVASCAQPIDYVEDDTDCDDGDADIHPDAVELCDGLDNDCDLLTDDDSAADVLTWYADDDADGYGDATVTDIDCAQPSGFVADATDCVDDAAAIHPDATEVCNGLDDNCDGAADGADAVGAQTWHQDDDVDGYGDAAVSVLQCDAPEGWLADDTDCDDTQFVVNPGATELCNDRDDDCDGVVDGGGAADALTWYADDDLDSFGDPADYVVDCAAPDGYGPDASDCDDDRDSVYPGAVETCNDRDDDCDGAVDDGASDVLTWYADSDADGYGDPSVVTGACDLPDGYSGNDEDCDDADAASFPGAEEVPYDGIDQDCDLADLDDLDGDGFVGLPAGGDDCDDGDADRHPGASERADGADDDCDGRVDDGTDDYDDDADGVTESGGDCNDGNAAIVPGASEAADYADNDCDGVVDEGTTLYDDDGDGLTEVGGDCDDTDTTVYEGAAEVDGNGIDDDCDGVVDDGAEDGDHDGYTSEGGDCDPESGEVHPGAAELADGLDNDCDGLTDEGTNAYDDDGDGLTEDGGDCNDADPNVYPGATERSDGVDNDCNGVVDDTLETSDDDGDGFTEEEGDCDDAQVTTYPGAPESEDGRDNDCDGDADEGGGDADADGYSAADGDCDDGDGWVNPGQSEMCDGVDNDCDEAIDEGCDGETPGTVKDTGSTTDTGGCGCASAGPDSLGIAALGLLATLLRRRSR